MAVEKKIYRYDEYEQIQALPENHDRLFELVEGKIVEKSYFFTPSTIAAPIGSAVGNYLDDHDIGFVTSADGGYIMSEDSVYVPDVGYISRIRLPEAPPLEAPVPPDMAVEVASPTDLVPELRRKAHKYLTFGTRLVWLVFPDEATAEVYMQGRDVETFGPSDTLNGGDLLPGFTLAVERIFTR